MSKSNQIVDGSSGLFTCALGHGRQEIANAVYKQMMANVNGLLQMYKGKNKN